MYDLDCIVALGECSTTEAVKNDFYYVIACIDMGNTDDFTITRRALIKSPCQKFLMSLQISNFEINFCVVVRNFIA